MKKEDIWFMKITVRNIVSVIAGVITSFCSGAILLYITIMTITDEVGLTGKLLFVITGFFIPCFSGGLVCGYISDRKDYLFVLITSFILILLVLFNNDFKGDLSNSRWLFLFPFIVFSTLAGGFAGIRIKKKPYNK
jgi:MFS family permease